MALIPAKILFRKQGYSVGGIEFDLLMSEQHSLENDVTTHRIEEGSEVTDNIRRKLRVGSLTGFISNYSIQSSGLVIPSIGGIDSNDVATNRVKQTYDLFVELWKKQEPVTIVTILEKEAYQNVAIVNVGISRSASDGESQRFDVSFRQIETARIVQINASSNIKPDGTGSQLGRQSSTKSNQGRTVGS